MATNFLSLHLADAEATASAARALAACLESGDVVLLTGAVGAGKTHFARALIGSILTTPEDIPSPTFTLVQTYESTRGDVWHADLYRLTDIREVDELGLSEAFDSAICLIEWPDRLGSLAPRSALFVTLTAGDAENIRTLSAGWDDAKWKNKLAGWQT